jgi:hypothetical protein
MADYSDEQDYEGLWEAIRERGRLVGRQEWDSGEATTKIWVDREFSDHDVAALNAQAAELRRQHHEKWGRRGG